ncbi:MAG: hypothetical protein ACKO96_00890, partial [Flammeovirgaceae bacterium]
FADEDGNPMALADNGQMYYLDDDGNILADEDGEPMSAGEFNLSDDDEFALSDNPFALSDGEYYPKYINPGNY